VFCLVCSVARALIQPGPERGPGGTVQRHLAVDSVRGPVGWLTHNTSRLASTPPRPSRASLWAAGDSPFRILFRSSSQAELVHEGDAQLRGGGVVDHGAVVSWVRASATADAMASRLLGGSSRGQRHRSLCRAWRTLRRASKCGRT